MNYSLLTDFEINKLVAQRMGYPITEKQPFGEKGQPPVRLAPGYGGYFDPCNNPADAWPILLENEISLVRWQSDNVWAAWSGAGMAYGEVECEHIEHDENPLRAAMIVFLMGG